MDPGELHTQPQGLTDTQVTFPFLNGIDSTNTRIVRPIIPDVKTISVNPVSFLQMRLAFANGSRLRKRIEKFVYSESSNIFNRLGHIGKQLLD